MLKKPVFRQFKETDYEAVCDFLIELNRPDKSHINWNWARFEWMYEHPEFDRSAAGSIGLWLDDGKIVGAAIYDMYFGEAFCGVLPEHDSLYPEVLDYAYRALRDDSGLAVAAESENTKEIEALKSAGFEPIDQKETIMRIGLERDFSAELPHGLRLAEMDQVEDREALEWLLWQGFDHGNDREEFERTEKIVTQPRQHFNKALSLAAVDQTGEPVACCCLWYRPDTDYAYVEPLCTVPGWRGKGAVKAILYEALARAGSLGAKQAFVISDLAFYEKLGFEKTLTFTFYRRTL